MKNKESSGRFFGASKIFGMLDRFANRLYNCFLFGFFGRIFTAYSTEERLFRQSAAAVCAKKIGHNDSHLRKARLNIAATFENSVAVRLYETVVSRIMACKLRIYGVFSFLLGSMIFAEYFILRYSFPGANADTVYNIFGAVLFAASIPLLASKNTLSEALKRSILCKKIIVGFFGIDDNRINKYSKRGGDSYLIAVISAFALAIITLFVNPLTVLLFILALVVFCLIMTIPETGVIITVFAVPFLDFSSHPTLSLCAMVSVTALSYIIKLICARRVFRFHLIDFFVTVFGAMIFFGGVFSHGGENSFRTAVSYCVLLAGYFLVVNLMRTKAWLNRCVNAFLLSATLVSLYGIFQYYFTDLEVKWLDVGMFPDISGRVVSTFDNPNMLSVYLVLALPFAVAHLLDSKNIRSIIWRIIQICLMGYCCVLTWSRGGWVGVIAAVILFFIMYSPHTLTAFIFLALPVCAVGPYAVSKLPSAFVGRFTSIVTASDSSSLFRFKTWKGVISMIRDNFIGGIGVGTDVFSDTYAAYAVSGTEVVKHAHSLYLQIFVSLGIIGILAFAVLIFLFLQNGLEQSRDSSDGTTRSAILAGISAIVGTLIMGTVDYIWYNMRVFFVFWFVFAIVCAYAYADRAEHSNSFVPMDPDETQSDIYMEIDLSNRSR